MVKVNPLLQEYANSVAGEVISPIEALELIEGWELYYAECLHRDLHASPERNSKPSSNS